MGFWLGTVFFVALELLGMFLVKSLIGTRQGRRHELLGQLLVATSVICCWLMWVIVYMGQMKVCLRVMVHRLGSRLDAAVGSWPLASPPLTEPHRTPPTAARQPCPAVVTGSLPPGAGGFYYFSMYLHHCLQ